MNCISELSIENGETKKSFTEFRLSITFVHSKNRLWQPLKIQPKN